MRSTAKVILFNRTVSGKTVHTRPVAVFTNTKNAMTYKAHLSAAHAAGDVDKLKSLDPGVHLTDDGALHTDSKWAILETPYEPEAVVPATEGDSFEF